MPSIDRLDPGARNCVWAIPWHINEPFIGSGLLPGWPLALLGGWSPRLMPAEPNAWPKGARDFLNANYRQREIGVQMRRSRSHLRFVPGHRRKSRYQPTRGLGPAVPQQPASEPAKPFPRHSTAVPGDEAIAKTSSPSISCIARPAIPWRSP